MKNTGFIGCGNMGGALARAAAKSIGGENIFLSDADEKKTAALSKEIGANAGSNKEIAAECKYIFLGVKPQYLEDMLSGIKDILRKRTDRFVLVTMAAGVSVEAVTKIIGKKLPVIRIMPNTPCAYESGMVLYCANAAVKKEEISEFTEILSKAGELDYIPESLIDAAAALSGCGPAYVYMFIEALADGAVSCGVPRDKAMKYAAQTVFGAAQTVIKSNMHPGALKDAVTSPGGTTIAGVLALEKGGFRAAAQSSVIAAYKKTLELKK